MAQFLVKAGLFSAVLTAFIVDVYKELNIDYTQDSATILHTLLQAQVDGQMITAALSLPTASPSFTVIIVIVLWFVSLVLSLLSALFSIFIKQWLHTYKKWTEVAHTNLQQGIMLRGFYQASFNIGGFLPSSPLSVSCSKLRCCSSSLAWWHTSGR
jgi:DMSO reductase anchor subunit